MCKTPPDINESLIYETIQEYARRKGLFVSKKETKSITTGFQNKYKRLPSFKEIWSIAEKVVIQKSAGEKFSLEEKVEKKMEEIEKVKEVKVERKKAIEEKRKGVEKPRVAPAVEKIEEEAAPEVMETPTTGAMKCAFCGASNPDGSKFCLECGSSISAPPKAVKEEVGVKCGKCGKINPKNEKFCLECGVLLAGKKESEELVERKKLKPEVIAKPLPTKEKTEEFEEKEIPTQAPSEAAQKFSASATTLLKTREFILQQKIMAFRETLKVKNGDNEVLGYFVKKIMSVGDTYRLKDLEENDILTVHQKVLALRATYRFYWGSEVDEDKLIGSIKQKLVAIKPSYWFEDPQENKIFTAKGNLFKYEFEIEKDGNEIAEVSRKLFKIKDTYGIRINKDVDDKTAMIIIGFCIMLQSQEEQEEQKKKMGFK